VWRHDGTIEAKPYGGSRSPLEDHAKKILAVIEEQPDLTLDEIVAGAWSALPRLETRACHPGGDRPRVKAERLCGLRDRQALPITSARRW
jgi:hypothetical protein